MKLQPTLALVAAILLPVTATAGPPSKEEAAKRYESRKVNITKLWRSVAKDVTAQPPANEDKAFLAARAIGALGWSAMFYPEHNKAEVDAQRNKYLGLVKKWPANARAMTIAMLKEFLGNKTYLKMAMGHHVVRMDYHGHKELGQIETLPLAMFDAIAEPYCRTLDTVPFNTKRDSKYKKIFDRCQQLREPDKKAANLVSVANDSLAKAEKKLGEKDYWGAVPWIRFARRFISHATQLKPGQPGLAKAYARTQQVHEAIVKQEKEQSKNFRLPADNGQMKKFKKAMKKAIKSAFPNPDKHYLAKKILTIRANFPWKYEGIANKRRKAWAWVVYKALKDPTKKKCIAYQLLFEQFNQGGGKWSPVEYDIEGPRVTMDCANVKK